jgi:hypothetical protein
MNPEIIGYGIALVVIPALPFAILAFKLRSETRRLRACSALNGPRDVIRGNTYLPHAWSK